MTGCFSLRLDDVAYTPLGNARKIGVSFKEMPMTYKVPSAPADPKQRYVVVTDPDEIAAIQRNGWGDPDGTFDELTQQWVATARSMQQYRETRNRDSSL